MSVGLRGNVMWGDDFDEDFLEVVLGVLVAEFGEGAFGEELARLDDAEGVAELLDFTHDVRGEDDRFAVVAAFADESGYRASGHDVAYFLRLLDNVAAADQGSAVGGLKDGGKHSKRGGFAGAVGAQETINPAGLADKADVIDGADFTALLVLEALGQTASFNHQRTPSWEFVRQGTERSDSTTQRAGKCYREGIAIGNGRRAKEKQGRWQRNRGFRTGRIDKCPLTLCDRWGTAWHQIDRERRETYCCTGCTRGG